MVRITKSHSTLIEEAEKIIKYLNRDDNVSRVSAGVIQSIGSGPIKVKITTDSGAILLQVRGSSSVQDVRIFSSDFQHTIGLIEKYTLMKKWKCDKNV